MCNKDEKHASTPENRLPTRVGPFPRSDQVRLIYNSNKCLMQSCLKTFNKIIKRVHTNNEKGLCSNRNEIIVSFLSQAVDAWNELASILLTRGTSKGMLQTVGKVSY